MAKQKNRVLNGFLQETNYLNSHLNPGEVPIYRAHLSWIPIFVAQVPFMLAGGLAGGIVWAVTNDFLIGCAVYIGAFILGALFKMPAVYKNVSTDILITNQGIHSKRKLFAIKDNQFVRYGYIDDAKLNYDSVVERLLQYGRVTITTVSGQASYDFDDLAKPMVFQNAVRAAQQKYRNSDASDMAMLAQMMRPQEEQSSRGRGSKLPGRSKRR